MRWKTIVKIKKIENLKKRKQRFDEKKTEIKTKKSEGGKNKQLKKVRKRYSSGKRFSIGSISSTLERISERIEIPSYENCKDCKYWGRKRKSKKIGCKLKLKEFCNEPELS